MTNIDEAILKKAKKWLEGNYDKETKAWIKNAIENNPKELTEAFYKDLEFGTGGLRGIMGIGSNRMNKYTVGTATQGLANYLKKSFPGEKIKAAIAYDCRNNSRYFAQVTADVLSANGIKVYLFDELKPTPELSFAIRHLDCHSGVVITASHNPKEYNGYKVYWQDGGQLISPHDKNVVEEARSISTVDEINFNANKELIETIGDDIDKVYVEKLKTVSLSPGVIEKHKDLKIVYTPIHGTGVKLAPMALKAFGFEYIISIPEQDEVNGDFPTVHSPNPEEPAALDLALRKAKEQDADILMGTDPDADRVGIAVKDLNGDFILLNGNQTAALIINYMLKKWYELGKLDGKQYICKTIVTTELLKDIADKYQVESYDVLTGFKYIADLIKQNEGKKTFIGGGEESYGYLMGEFVRDKDAIMSCCMIAETAAWAKEQGKTMYELLIDIYLEYGLYKESLKSVVKKGKEGEEAIKQMMADFRNKPIDKINDSKVILFKDYQAQQCKNLKTGEVSSIDLPQSNVLQFFTEDGSKITIRPSGTEPKIKFYFAVNEKLETKEDFESVDQQLNKRIENIKLSLGI